MIQQDAGFFAGRMASDAKGMEAFWPVAALMQLDVDSEEDEAESSRVDELGPAADLDFRPADDKTISAVGQGVNASRHRL